MDQSRYVRRGGGGRVLWEKRKNLALPQPETMTPLLQVLHPIHLDDNQAWSLAPAWRLSEQVGHCSTGRNRSGETDWLFISSCCRYQLLFLKLILLTGKQLRFLVGDAWVTWVRPLDIADSNLRSWPQRGNVVIRNCS
ncbi:hypothetical protein O181_016863 [Austropuccinia psidii MF-1]|uniref:Uncharacterized protein n=1 Tax=Austropuccinia psidii MF-1 TaxID=1389203 RepID=A0A9Q3C622_9BASI|nr:hypothetical protein [Austropuccinia psidii MF-1]